MDEDVQNIIDLKMKSYSMSFAWTKIYGANGLMNPGNIAQYIVLLQKLKENNIEVVGTLESWDLPDEFFQNGKQGWADDETVDRFLTYGKACYTQFYQFVDRWIPITNIEKSIFLGYANHNYPPASFENK